MKYVIPYSKDEREVNEEQFDKFIQALSDMNSDLSGTSIKLIKGCIDRHKITPKELNDGFMDAFEDPDRYGKMEWNDIWKHIHKQRENRPQRRTFV